MEILQWVDQLFPVAHGKPFVPLPRFRAIHHGDIARLPHDQTLVTTLSTECTADSISDELLLFGWHAQHGCFHAFISVANRSVHHVQYYHATDAADIALFNGTLLHVYVSSPSRDTLWVMDVLAVDGFATHVLPTIVERIDYGRRLYDQHRILLTKYSLRWLFLTYVPWADMTVNDLYEDGVVNTLRFYHGQETLRWERTLLINARFEGQQFWYGYDGKVPFLDISPPSLTTTTYTDGTIYEFEHAEGAWHFRRVRTDRKHPDSEKRVQEQCACAAARVTLHDLLSHDERRAVKHG